MLRRTVWCHSSLKRMNALGTFPVVARGAGGGRSDFAARAAELHVPAQHNALTAGTRAAWWKASIVTEAAHRSHPSLGRVCHPRRAAHHHHHTRRIIIEAGMVERLKRNTTTARLSVSSSSSIHTNASSLRYDAVPRDDDDGASTTTNLTREIADSMRVHDIVRPRDRCDLSGKAAEGVVFFFLHDKKKTLQHNPFSLLPARSSSSRVSPPTSIAPFPNPRLCVYTESWFASAAVWIRWRCYISSWN